MNGKINLYLDDSRDCPEGFTLARTVEQAKHYFDNYRIDILSLDYDLGVDAEGNLLPTGLDFVQYICENRLRANRIYIHTDDSLGRDSMYQSLLDAQRKGFIDKDIVIKIIYFSMPQNNNSKE